MNSGHGVPSGKSHAAVACELDFQKSRADAIPVAATPAYIIERYRRCKLWRFIQKEFTYRALGELRDRTVLDFACGDLAAVVPVLYDCLKPGGRIVIGEPGALSPFLQRIRDMLPVSKKASPDERQLVRADLDFIARVCANCRFTYFNLFSRFTRFIPNADRIDRGHPFAKAAVVLLGALDRLAAPLPGVYRFYGPVVAVGEKPSGRGLW